ncbi:serine phosphatase RsbU (regulator of sigma subunit)/anti-sigma regulatory factor (Ser/Thr protein kinase) [Kitasatospora sp. MAA19]|uniref:SpoIIE family protein phosphatase n=1 Tax=Kitasatospora sp. MAA19 TaxID=3035090 RepID=UPI002476090B|nr:SpoIIE family protein phosphatase [Kitasatospora sp. MAA19]MDH6703704.1 serine phosphatase RsbU (regulator of sigma subunit)/anti-sigma regulatory factor (Ser/Thr protein kinase) [Kitasatospora sp. MAA19]
MAARREQTESMVAESNSTPRPADAETVPGDHPTGVAALVRLALVLVDRTGRIAQWSRAAEELFGHRAEVAHDRPASGLLPAVEPFGAPGQATGPVLRRRCDALDTLAALTATGRPWAGQMAVIDREEHLRDVLWWAYPLPDPPGGLLALAADARPLRTAGPRLALGERLLPFAATPPARGGFHRLGAALTPPGRLRAGLLPADQLAGLLPAGSADRRALLLDVLDQAGLPALRLDPATVLPVLPADPQASAAHAAAGLGRRYPTAQQRAARVGPPPQPEQSSPAARTVRGRPSGPLPTQREAAERSAAQPTGAPAGVPSLTTPAPTTPAPTTPAPTALSQAVPSPTGGGAAIEPAAVEPPATGHPARHADQAPPAHAPGDAEGGPPGRLGSFLTNGQAGEQLALLNEVGGKVGTTLDLGFTAHELCKVLVPRVADFACVDLVDGLISDSELPVARPDDDTMLRRVALVYNETSGAWDHVLAEGSLVSMPRRTPPGMALQLNQPVLVPVVSADVAVDYAIALGGARLAPVVTGRSMLVVPLSARGTVLGILKLLRLPDRAPFDESDAATLKELAVRAALSLDNARLHRAEARVATTLQRSMIPTRPPQIPGVQIAHRYLPGDPKAEVGGDWFDAIQLPGSRVALVVGDVMGHGLHSAAAMGRFRTAMQTLAALDLPPGQLLRHLDNLAHKLGDDHLATCLYAVYDPINRTCELASAGHVPPVLVHPDGSGELLEIPAGAPIGVGGVPFVAKTIDVSDGSMLVLCTDGLVEVRGGDIGAGLAALCGNLIDPRQSPEQACDVVLKRLHSDDRKDDVALLVARFDGVAPSEVATWDLTVDHREVRRARSLVREQLAGWHLEALSDITELLVSELVTNAVRVARDRVQLQLIRVDKLLVEVSDDNHNLPSLEPAEQLGETGRGLTLVTKLAERWGTARKAVGKVVWFELPLPHACRPGPAPVRG